jgi:hypothetical protein
VVFRRREEKLFRGGTLDFMVESLVRILFFCVFEGVTLFVRDRFVRAIVVRGEVDIRYQEAGSRCGQKESLCVQASSVVSRLSCHDWSKSISTSCMVMDGGGGHKEYVTERRGIYSIQVMMAANLAFAGVCAF